MLKMIIADDESFVRNGLKNIIDWVSFGIEIIADAEDGLEALELCQKLQPDILFTDIRMPIMDGLEVAMKLKELELDIRTIIISGIQDFNYAKTALDVDVEGYILKPVKIDELTELIKKVVSRIKLERNNQSEMINLKLQLQEHFPIIREKFLRNLVFGVYSDDLQLKNKLEYFKLSFEPQESFMAAVLQIDDYGKTIDNTSEEDKQLLSFSISNILEEIITNYDSGVSFCLNENEFIIIFKQNALFNGKYMDICEEIISLLGKFLHISVSIGIGRSVSGLLSIISSFSDARSALQYKFYTGKGSILDIRDINIMNEITSESTSHSSLYDIEDQLMNFTKSGDSEGAGKTIDRLFDHLCSDRSIPVDYIQSICVELVCITSRTIQDLGENIDHIAGNRSGIIETVYKAENAIELKNYIHSIFVKITDYLSQKYSQKNSRVINKIKEMIEQRYQEDISVAKISEEVFLTPNYISMIFKKEMNETISEYITKIRMEKAKTLLKTTDLRILEVAEKVGYEDPHYFTKVFKKYTGVLPQKYRC